MSDFKLGYITAFGTRYDGRIQKIAKSADKLRPIYEAFTNAYDAIKNISEGKIVFSIQLNKTLFSVKDEDLEFDNITIEDNGVGFNDEEFTRLKSPHRSIFRIELNSNYFCFCNLFSVMCGRNPFT